MPETTFKPILAQETALVMVTAMERAHEANGLHLALIGRKVDDGHDYATRATYERFEYATCAVYDLRHYREDGWKVLIAMFNPL